MTTKMTAKDYRKIGRAIGSVFMPPHVRTELVLTLVRVLAADNPQFKDWVFSADCGLYVCQLCKSDDPAFMTTNKQMFDQHFISRHI